MDSILLSEKRWYNFETASKSVKDGLRSYLKKNNIDYEISECGSGWHFEINIRPEMVSEIDDFIDALA